MIVEGESPEGDPVEKEFIPLKADAGETRFFDLKPQDAQAIPLPERQPYIPLERTRVSTSRIDNP